VWFVPCLVILFCVSLIVVPCLDASSRCDLFPRLFPRMLFYLFIYLFWINHAVCSTLSNFYYVYL
jgi:hypothetical protein